MAYGQQFNPYGGNYPVYNIPNQGVSQPSQTMPVQNNGFISVPSEEVARNWPLAHGNSVSFKDENAPFIYTKTLGFGQLEQPVFEKYRLIKENDTQESPQEAAGEPQKHFATVEDIESLRITMKHFKSDLDVMRKKMEKLTNRRDEVDEDA